MKRKSILVKTFLNLFAVMILLIIIIHVSIFYIYRNFYISNCTKQIEADMKNVIDILENTDDCDAVLSAYVKNNHVNICFKTQHSTKFYHGSDIYVDFNSEEDALVNVQGMEGTESMLFRTKELTLKDGKSAVVQLSMNLQQLKESRGIALALLPYSICVSLLFSLLFSYFYSKKITNPILKMSATVKQMTDMNEDAKIQICNEDELGVLADDINELYKNLLKVVNDYKIKTEEVLHLERERLDFFRGASHELKTPLAKLSVLTENMRYNIGKYKDHDKYLEESLLIIHELSVMISEILNGVKKIPIQSEEIKPIQMRESLVKIADNYQLIAKAKHCNMNVSIEGNFEIYMSEIDLQKVLSNVISNAIKYVTVEGKISIILTDQKLCIYNDADPISEEIMKTIWKGEYILEKSEDLKSSGLGLYIVKTILDRYQIKYSFEAYRDGYLFTIKK